MRFFASMLCGLMDHPAAQVNGGYKSSVQAAFPCRRCLVPHANLASTHPAMMDIHGCRDHKHEDRQRRLVLDTVDAGDRTKKRK